MGGGVHRAVLRFVVLREVLAVAGRVERELEHLHSRVRRLSEQLAHRRSDDTEILRDNAAVSGLLLYHAEQVVLRTFAPLAAVGGLASERYRIVAVEADEVVDAHDVVYLLCKAYSADPPAVIVLLHSVPVVDRIAPELAVGGKSVRREACCHSRDSVAVKLEQLRLTPDVRAVKGAVYRDIADYLNAVVVGVFLELMPLLEELELQEDVEIHLGFVFLLRGLHRRRLAKANVTIPLQRKAPVSVLHHLVELLVHRGVINVARILAPLDVLVLALF